MKTTLQGILSANREWEPGAAERGRMSGSVRTDLNDMIERLEHGEAERCDRGRGGVCK